MISTTSKVRDFPGLRLLFGDCDEVIPLLLGEDTPFSRSQGPQFKLPDFEADEPLHAMVDCLDHVADLALHSGGEDDLDPAR